MANLPINEEQEGRRLPPLKQDDRLAAAAQVHSQDMAANDFFDHVGSDGSRPGDPISSQGYRWTFYAENVGCGHDLPADVVRGWMSSAGHRANLLSVDAEHVGIGVADGADTRCATCWTVVFAASD
jgi:uncharacterized protein YkwD